MKYIKLISYIFIILISGHSYANNNLSCRYLSVDKTAKQIAIDTRRNGYWLLDNKYLYFLDNQDNIQLIANLNLKLTQDAHGVTLYNNNLVLRSTNTITEYNADAIYTDGRHSYSDNHSRLDIKNQAYRIAEFPNVGSIHSQNSKIYTDNKYIYAAYGGLVGRQMNVWEKNNDEWSSRSWLDGSNDAYGVTMGNYKNKLYFRLKNEKFFSLCTYDRCYYHKNEDSLPVFETEVATFNHNEDLCVLPLSMTSKSATIYCQNKGEIYLDNVANLYKSGTIEDVAYNPMNNGTYILHKNGFYKCE